jgi:hypothetical protein
MHPENFCVIAENIHAPKSECDYRTHEYRLWIVRNICKSYKKNVLLYVCVRFEVFKLVIIKNPVFWDETCGSCANRCFGRLYRLRHQGKKSGSLLAVTANVVPNSLILSTMMRRVTLLGFVGSNKSHKASPLRSRHSSSRYGCLIQHLLYTIRTAQLK